MPRWQMEVVELSDQGAPKWYCKKRGEREKEGRPNPSRRATDSHLQAARFAIKWGREQGWHHDLGGMKEFSLNLHLFSRRL